MDNYYSKNFSAERLKRRYDIAPQRIRQYMKAEVEHVLSKIKKEDKVLDLMNRVFFVRLQSKIKYEYTVFIH